MISRVWLSGIISNRHLNKAKLDFVSYCSKLAKVLQEYIADICALKAVCCRSEMLTTKKKLSLREKW